MDTVKTSREVLEEMIMSKVFDQAQSFLEDSLRKARFYYKFTR